MVAVAALAACSTKQEDPEPGEGGRPEETVTPPPEAKTPAFKITPIEPPLAKKYLRVYYQHDSIPVSWVEAWLQGKDITVVQRALPQWENSKWPADGDLYIVEPRSLGLLQQLISFAAWPAGEDADALNPIFTGYAFDPDNFFSRPWRWTPYLFLMKKPKEDAPAVALNGADWFSRQDIAWPADEALLKGLWKKRRGFSANMELGQTDEEAWTALWTTLRVLVRDEETCWKDLIHDRAAVAVLPASRRLQARSAEQVGVDDGLLWRAPDCGTLLRIEYLMVRSGCERQVEAFDLAASLLSTGRQAELTQTTGYFPVRSHLGHVMDAFPLPVPPDGWVDRSEFLNAGLPEPEEKAAEKEGEPAQDAVMESVDDP
jgi:hypothetical protein